MDSSLRLLDSDEDYDGFSTVAFVINGVVLCLIIGIAAFCWFQNGCIYGSPNAYGISPSDLEYARVVLERQRQEEERRRGTPEQRSKRLRQKFGKEEIVMVRDINHSIESHSTWATFSDCGKQGFDTQTYDGFGPRFHPIPQSCQIDHFYRCKFYWYGRHLNGAQPRAG